MFSDSENTMVTTFKTIFFGKGLNYIGKYVYSEWYENSFKAIWGALFPNIFGIEINSPKTNRLILLYKINKDNYEEINCGERW